MDKIKLGSGPLSWHRMERVSDRYGSVFFTATSSDEKPLDPVVCDPSQWKECLGKKGKLVAEVVTPRKSSHIGDLFRGFFPSIPEAGEIIELGEGELFYEDQRDEFHAIGLRPDDGRKSDWLIAENLYRAHEQTVNLWFIPTP